MKKWLRFFCLGFFSDDISKEGAKRGYTNFFIALILAFVLLWLGFVGTEMLPFSTHYNNSEDFRATVRSVLANPDPSKRIYVDIDGNLLKAKKQGGEYAETLLVNTFESDADRQDYSVSGYNVVIDSRPADTLAEVEAYCLSNDGQNVKISYQDYLALNDAAKYNFDFKLEYTGSELILDDESVANYRAYVESLGDENKVAIEKLSTDLAEGNITKEEYDRNIYELYFTNYYPEITDYESSSKVPLLRNYYYHRYIKTGECKYLFIFDDYLAGSFETNGGIEVSFYGFYADLENGRLIGDSVEEEKANLLADGFIKKSFSSIILLTLYAYAMNVFSFIPFITLMPMVVTLLAYSILRLRGVDSIASLGAMFKIVGSYVWVSGFISAALSVIASFFVQSNILSVLPIVLFFVILAVRSIIFTVNESRSYIKQLEELEEAAARED